MNLPADQYYIPQSVLNAALALHQGGSEELIYRITPAEAEVISSNSFSSVIENQIVFKSLEARNNCTAEAALQRLIPRYDFDTILDTAFTLWQSEIGHSDSASGRFMGLASGSVNVLWEAAKIIEIGDRDVFDVLQVLDKALPHLLVFRAQDIVALVKSQYELTKHDHAGSLIFNSIESRLRAVPALAWDVVKICRGEMSEVMQCLYGAAMQSLMHTTQQSLALDVARVDAEVADPLVACAALWAISRAIHTYTLVEDDIEKCVAALVGKTCADSKEIRHVALRAVAHASIKDERLMSELARLVDAKAEHTLAVVADMLFMNHRNLPVSNRHFKTLLKSLVGLSPNQHTAIHHFDWILCQLYITPEHRQLVLECLTQWIINHGGSGWIDQETIELFDQTIRRISTDQLSFQALITRWLIAPERKLAAAFSGLINVLYIRRLKEPKFSPAVLDTFSQQDFKFLVRRMLGYVLSEEPLLSLTLSLLETCKASERTFDWVSSLLTEEVGRDYEDATMEALTARLVDAESPERELLKRIHAILIQRRTANDGLPRLQELRPPVRLQRAIALKRGRDMEMARSKADEKSTIRATATLIPVKAGVGFFSVTSNQFGSIQKFQSISHFVTLPKRSVTDPVGYAIAGLQFRISKRDDE